MKHYSKAVFSERTALTEAIIEFLRENPPLEALETGTYSGCSSESAGMDEKSA